MPRLSRLLLAFCAATLLSALPGCVPYPTYKTLQPRAAITVQDETGQPLATARVVLIAGAYPYGYDRSRV
ncbi:hypothetical protein ACV36C_40900, partial [Pseudomonas aeruginosa]